MKAWKHCPSLSQNDINSNSEKVHTVFAKKYKSIPYKQTSLYINKWDNSIVWFNDLLIDCAWDCVQPRWVFP